MMNDQNQDTGAAAAQDEEFKPRKRGLGRGLNALFDDEEEGHAPAPPAAAAEEPAGKRSRPTMGVDQLMPRRDQPRKLFHEETLRELADSIAQYGILQPLLVRPLREMPGSYEIIAGERRWRAAQIAQLHEVPVIEMDIEDEQAFKIAMIENLQREDLDAVDEANGYQAMMDAFGYTQEKLAEVLGKSRSHVTNVLRLRKLPDLVLNHLGAGNISAGHARALLAAKEPGKIIDAIIQQNLSVRQTEVLVAQDSASLQQPRKDMARKQRFARGEDRDINIIHLEQSLMAETGLHIFIDTLHTGKSGKVEIAFKTLDQLDEILKYLRRGASVAGDSRESSAARLMD